MQPKNRTCTNCGGGLFDVFYSLDKLYCLECGTWLPYKLKPKQKSLLIKGKTGVSKP